MIASARLDAALVVRGVLAGSMMSGVIILGKVMRMHPGRRDGSAMQELGAADERRLAQEQRQHQADDAAPLPAAGDHASLRARRYSRPAAHSRTRPPAGSGYATA